MLTIFRPFNIIRIWLYWKHWVLSSSIAVLRWISKLCSIFSPARSLSLFSSLLSFIFIYLLYLYLLTIHTMMINYLYFLPIEIIKKLFHSIIHPPSFTGFLSSEPARARKWSSCFHWISPPLFLILTSAKFYLGSCHSTACSLGHPAPLGFRIRTCTRSRTALVLVRSWLRSWRVSDLRKSIFFPSSSLWSPPSCSCQK